MAGPCTVDFVSSPPLPMFRESIFSSLVVELVEVSTCDLSSPLYPFGFIL